jgi:hypothetical protein
MVEFELVLGFLEVTFSKHMHQLSCRPVSWPMLHAGCADIPGNGNHDQQTLHPTRLVVCHTPQVQ